jgi:hypothetical protein
MTKTNQYRNAINNNIECAQVTLNEWEDLEATERLLKRALMNLTRLANVTAIK